MTAGLKLLAKAFDKILNLGAAMAAILVLFMIFSTGYEVAVRYLGFTPPIWRLQFNEYALLWITFLAAAWLLKREGHVRVEVVTSRLEPRARVLATVVTSVVSGLLCLGVSWVASRIVWNQYVRGAEEWGAVTVPVFAVICIIPIGSFMLFIQFIRRAYGCLESREQQ